MFSGLIVEKMLLVYVQGIFFMVEVVDDDQFYWFDLLECGILLVGGVYVLCLMWCFLWDCLWQVSIDCDFFGVIVGCVDCFEIWINGRFVVLYDWLFVMG